MAKLQYNEISQKKTVVMDGDPYLILSSAISKKDRQKASNNVKMKNLRSGNVLDRTFHQADVLEEADLEKREIKYLYNNRGEYFFCPPNNPGRISVNGLGSIYRGGCHQLAPRYGKTGVWRGTTAERFVGTGTVRRSC